MRGRGLGSELVARSLKIAGEVKKCRHYIVCATGNASARIYAKLGFSIKEQMSYQEYRDSRDRQIVDRAGENTHAQTMTRELAE